MYMKTLFLAASLIFLHIVEEYFIKLLAEFYFCIFKIDWDMVIIRENKSRPQVLPPHFVSFITKRGWTVL